MAVAGVFAITDVGHDQQIRGLLLNRANRPLHDALVVVRAGGVLILVLRYAEKDHSADT